MLVVERFTAALFPWGQVELVALVQVLAAGFKRQGGEERVLRSQKNSNVFL
jgi:hypothetical protein